jgi:hypothetical protein
MSGMTGAASRLSHIPSHLPKTVLSPDDIQASITAYEILLTTAKAYRNALATLAQTANAFGAALESCARLKGVDEASEGLLSTAGLHFLIANHQSVLSDTVYRSYEIPLRENLESFIQDAGQRREAYLAELGRRKKLLAEREKKHLALAHRNKRSLSEFRTALNDLTMLADDIDKLKSDYFFTSLGSHHETWHRVATRSGIVCKAELQLYSAIGHKQECMMPFLRGIVDPWEAEARSGDDLFSIVPPQEILARPQSPSHETGLFASLLGTLHEAESTPDSAKTTHAHAHKATIAQRNDLFSASPKQTGAGMSAVPVVTRFHAEQEQTPTRTSQNPAVKRASSALKRLSGERVVIHSLETPTRLMQESEANASPLDEEDEALQVPSSPYEDAEEPDHDLTRSTVVSPAKATSAGSIMRPGSMPSTPIKPGSAFGSTSTRRSQTPSAQRLAFQREIGSSASQSRRLQLYEQVDDGSAEQIGKGKDQTLDEQVYEGTRSPESFDKHSEEVVASLDVLGCS